MQNIHCLRTYQYISNKAMRLGEWESYRGARWNGHDRYDDKEYQLTSPVSLACNVSVGHTGSMFDAISVVMLLLYIHPLSHLPSGTQPKKKNNDYTFRGTTADDVKVRLSANSPNNLCWLRRLCQCLAVTFEVYFLFLCLSVTDSSSCSSGSGTSTENQTVLNF